MNEITISDDMAEFLNPNGRLMVISVNDDDDINALLDTIEGRKPEDAILILPKEEHGN